jgi:Zn-dependent M16 (insulinase) family peptidase
VTEMIDQNNPEIEADCRKFGYRLEDQCELNEINAVLYQLVHRPTGARHIHISNQDRENTFSVAFKTVPTDSTGVAHILEHTVLCGSEKFPVRDPFFAMLKRSLSTFMNAFTASDWTMYPFSTQNKKDFYNLMDVYLDAAFFPKIERLSFKQEGCRLEVEDGAQQKDGVKLVYKGVVYNEMKGAMSSPDQVIARSLMNALYPDTTYSYNSGGDPAAIPSLTYDRLKQFHARHYHPSNAFFYTYGNLPLTEHLAFVHDKVLQRFQPIDPKTEVASQPRWREPKRVVYPYPFSASEDPRKKFQVCVAWLCADIKETFQVLVFKLLEQILIGNSASPLRKSLIDSGLGSALCDATGYDADNRDTLFACGLKDVYETDAEQIEGIIFGVLDDLVAKGIDRALIESAIHQIEFHRKEITNSPYPYGIKLLLTFVGSWLHGGNPQNVLQLDADLALLRQKLEERNFFEEQIQAALISNPHRVLFVLKPDPLMEKKELERVRSELDSKQAAMDAVELAKIREDAAALKKIQESAEDISSLPTLSLLDIPVSVPVVKPTKIHQNAPVVCYHQPTSGIFYFTAALGAGEIQADLLPLVPFFCFALPKIGTKQRDFTAVVKEIDRYTGGINFAANVRTRFDKNGDGLPFLSFSGKCLNRNLDRLFQLVSEIAFEVSFADISRLKSLLLEYRSGLESAVVHNGHRYAISLASRTFSSTSYLSEVWSGIHQLRYIKKITTDLHDDALAGIAGQLHEIAQRTLDGKNMKPAIVGEKEPLSRWVDNLSRNNRWADLEHNSNDGNRFFREPPLNVQEKPEVEGWSTSTAVSFVAQTFKTVRMEHEDAPRLAVISKMLRSLYLHREIREKGGAYGAFALYNMETGLFSLASYRDPHIAATLNAFQGAAEFIAAGKFNNEDVKEAILQICSEIDKPDPPGPAAKKAFYRDIIALSDESRRRFKERLLALTRKEVMQTASQYFRLGGGTAGVAVISGEAQLRAAQKTKPAEQLRLYAI